jgi:glycosyltransferase involved in cell wall biosynthesis
VLLEAFEELPPDARLSVAGSPGYEPAYAEWLQRAARHPGIRFVGAVAPADVPAFLAGADALVVPSIWNENSPLTIHEGFLAGIPVVASRMGGSTELIEAGGGLLYDADRPEALRAALRRLYDEPGLARRLAASAPAVKSMKDHVAELVALYDSVRFARRSRA